ncbi:MAG: NDP-sugar synthase [Deltaproteobacteria bacterium]|nr:NDP-sugar synthase [Deltaproteobacteria bacterium]
MKAMILAAGYGTRLGILGKQLPKGALKVLGKPIIKYVIDFLKSEGISEFVINSHHLGDMLPDMLGNGSGMDVRINWSRESGQVLGTGGGVNFALPLLGDGPFVVLNGKIITDFDFNSLLRQHKESGNIATMVLRKDPDASKWGSVGCNEGRISSILGKNSNGEETGSAPYMFTGIQIIEKEFFKDFPEGPACLIRDGYLKYFRKNIPIGGFIMSDSDYWFEHSTPSRYLQGNFNLLDKRRISILKRHNIDTGMITETESGRIFSEEKIPQDVKCTGNVVTGKNISYGDEVVINSSVVWDNTSVEGVHQNEVITPMGIAECDGTEGFTGPALKK